LPSILFVSHNASRSGAPIELLHFLRWFKKNGDRPFSVLLGGDGELVSDFSQLADTWSLDRSHWLPRATRTTIFNAIRLGKVARLAEISDVRRFAAKSSPALIYVNSIASAQVIELLEPKVPVLTHVHELEFAFRKSSREPLLALLAQTQQFIACSNAVRNNLIHAHGVRAERVETVHEAIPFDAVRAERTGQQVFQELRLPADALLVAASGIPCWRKGADIFLQLAREVCRRRGRAYFVWIGGGSASDIAKFEHDVRMLGLMERVCITGTVLDPWDYMAAADVFTLTSREDPYPLVCLEVAALGKPILCFEGAGGMPEFIEEDCGFAVPYIDVTAMADRVLFLLDHADCRLSMGRAARLKVSQRHDINAAAPRIMELMERTIAGQPYER
jgi:glycosyltransferase involved in cell wall biosynthesis